MFLFTVHIHNEWPKTGWEWPHRNTVRCGGRSGRPPKKPLSVSKSNLLSGSSQARRVTGPSKLLASAIPKGPVGTIFLLLPIQLAGVAPSIATAAFPLVVSTGGEAAHSLQFSSWALLYLTHILFIICRCRSSIGQSARYMTAGRLIVRSFPRRLVCVLRSGGADSSVCSTDRSGKKRSGDEVFFFFFLNSILR